MKIRAQIHKRKLFLFYTPALFYSGSVRERGVDSFARKTDLKAIDLIKKVTVHKACRDGFKIGQ